MSRRMLAPRTTLPRLIACAWIAIACAACGSKDTSTPLGEAQAAPPRYVYKFVPAKPVASNGKVIGLFTLADGTLAQGTGNAGIESPGTGGACLVGDFSATFDTPACSKQDDCNDLLTRFHAAAQDGVPLEQRHAYCLPLHKPGPKRCWIRTGDYCLRSGTEPWVVGTDNLLPAAPADPLKNGKRVRWMVHTCLSRYDVGPEPACKSTDLSKSWTWDGIELVLH